MNTFISCDWGTTSFRLRLLNLDTNEVLGEVKTDEGNAAVYKEWKEAGAGADRLSFYTRILTDGIRQLEEACNCYVANNTIVMSGMASSTIGMRELPYKALPFALDGSDLVTETIAATDTLPHPLLFISGARTGDDVMRGEETKLVGCQPGNKNEEQLIIMPGTHAKHVTVTTGKATSFRTYMTGELFQLLSAHSVLSASVEGNKDEHPDIFVKGVTEAANNNLLNSLFHVRTARLFEAHSPKENYHYLSGLLIGSELKSLQGRPYSHITLLSTGVFTQLYLQALATLNITNVQHTDADKALMQGQSMLFRQRQ